MTTLDFLYISLGVGFLMIAVFVSYLLNQVSKSLKIVVGLIENIAKTADTIRMFKNSLISNTLKVISKVLKGEFYVSKR